MPLKIPGALKRIQYLFRISKPERNTKPERSKCPHLSMHKENVIKLATVRVMPNLRLLSFRVSKNYLYFSFARPQTDLQEFIELCREDDE